MRGVKMVAAVDVGRKVRDTILEELFNRSGWNFQGLFRTCVVLARSRIIIFRLLLTLLLDDFRGKKGVKKFKSLPFFFYCPKHLILVPAIATNIYFKNLLGFFVSDDFNSRYRVPNFSSDVHCSHHFDAAHAWKN